MAKTSSKTTETSKTDASQTPPLTINAQYIKDLSFEHPDPVSNYEGSNQQPDISINIDVAGNRIKDRNFEVVLSIRASAERGGNSVFMAELQYGGIFTLSDSVPDEAIHPVLMIECPRLLFPYARSILSNTTRDGGFPPLSLNPIDFAGLYRRQMEEQKAQSDQGNGADNSTTQNDQPDSVKEKSQQRASVN